MNKILKLASALPSGLNDKKAAKKLAAEMRELEDAVKSGDTVGAWLEAADVAYYAVKSIDRAANLAGLDFEQVLKVARIKYALRARVGNPKNDAEERAAVKEAIA